MISDTRDLWHADMIRSAAARPRDQVALGINRRWQERSTQLARVGVSPIANRYSLWIREYFCLASAAGADAVFPLARESPRTRTTSFFQTDEL